MLLLCFGSLVCYWRKGRSILRKGGGSALLLGSSAQHPPRLYPSRSRDSKGGFLKSLFEGVKRRRGARRRRKSSSFLIHMLLFLFSLLSLSSLRWRMDLYYVPRTLFENSAKCISLMVDCIHCISSSSPSSNFALLLLSSCWLSCPINLWCHFDNAMIISVLIETIQQQ